MMRLWLIPVVLLGSVLLAAPATGQDATGACWNLVGDNPTCTPDLTQQQCVDLYFWVEPGWSAGLDCRSVAVDFDWDGSCLLELPNIGERCGLFWSVPGADLDSITHCDEEDGTWFGDNLNCEETPVPAMPQPALALMAFVILGAALAALSSKAA